MVKQPNKNTVKHASIGYNFSNGVQVTDHFIERAQERFGVRDLHDKDKNRQYTESWATELLSDYEILEEQNDTYLLKCKEIVIVWSRTEKVCITCYSIKSLLMKHLSPFGTTNFSKTQVNWLSYTRSYPIYILK